MPRRRWSILVVLAAWTALVWATRLDNIWNDPDLTTSGQLWRSLLVASFVVAAAALVWVATRTFRRPPTQVDARVVQVVAVWTAAVWVIRIGGIVMGDYGTAFIVVHVVLGVVSIALAGAAVWACRELPVASDRSVAPLGGAIRG